MSLLMSLQDISSGFVRIGLANEQTVLVEPSLDEIWYSDPIPPFISSLYSKIEEARNQKLGTSAAIGASSTNVGQQMSTDTTNPALPISSQLPASPDPGTCIVSTLALLLICV